MNTKKSNPMDWFDTPSQHRKLDYISLDLHQTLTYGQTTGSMAAPEPNLFGSDDNKKKFKNIPWIPIALLLGTLVFFGMTYWLYTSLTAVGERYVVVYQEHGCRGNSFLKIMDNRCFCKLAYPTGKPVNDNVRSILVSAQTGIRFKKHCEKHDHLPRGEKNEPQELINNSYFSERCFEFDGEPETSTIQFFEP